MIDVPEFPPQVTPPLADGRFIVGRGVYPTGKTPWVRPMAPGWMHWLLASRNVLGRRGPGGAESIIVNRHEDDPPAYEYRLMTQDELRAENERHPYGERRQAP